jgi:hypothetical protein
MAIIGYVVRLESRISRLEEKIDGVKHDLQNLSELVFDHFNGKRPV